MYHHPTCVPIWTVSTSLTHRRSGMSNCNLWITLTWQSNVEIKIKISIVFPQTHPGFNLLLAKRNSQCQFFTYSCMFNKQFKFSEFIHLTPAPTTGLIKAIFILIF